MRNQILFQVYPRETNWLRDSSLEPQSPLLCLGTQQVLKNCWENIIWSNDKYATLLSPAIYIANWWKVSSCYSSVLLPSQSKMQSWIRDCSAWVPPKGELSHSESPGCIQRARRGPLPRASQALNVNSNVGDGLYKTQKVNRDTTVLREGRTFFNY